VAQARTIVVTGMGVLAAAGDSPDELWQTVVRGASPAVSYADPAAPGSPAIPACVVAGPGEEAIRRRRSQKMDRCVQIALEAAVQAHADAGLHTRTVERSLLGIIAGTSRGPVRKWNESVDLVRSGRRELPPTLAANNTLDCLSGALSMALDAGGPCLTVSATCASAAHAIALAAQQIVLGEAEVMIAGGADAPLHDTVIRQILATGILGSHADAREACRPFDVTRNGTLIGEGAAFLVLESLESARRRAVPVRARLVGWAMGADATHRSSPRADGEGLVLVMRRALRVAGIGPEEIDYVNTHGTGTPLNDRIEAIAMRRLLGERAHRVACSSTKPVTGHCLGASAAMEAVITVLALGAQIAPPTPNCRELDPECALDVVTSRARTLDMRVAMSNSLGFWGKNASLIFARAGDSLN
jgi:3-oxoacyl-[acyl-carrier-protein] synthase II